MVSTFRYRGFAQRSAAKVVLALGLCLGAASIGSAGTIYTAAGNGTNNEGGDNGPATLAGIPYPRRLATDAAGNLYITESFRVRKIQAGTGIISTFAGTGIISTFAGSGNHGTAGSSGFAPAMDMLYIEGVACDSAGNVYFSNSYGFRVYKVLPATGMATTYAGVGTSCHTGDGGPATWAQLHHPSVLAFDPDDHLYIVDSQTIRRVHAVTRIITTIAGTATWGYSGDGGPATAAQLASPQGLAADHLGHLYVADTGNQRVRRIDLASGTITTVAGNGVSGYSGDGGPALMASLSAPGGLACDPEGNLFISDLGNRVIRKLDVSDGRIWTVAGNGENGSAGDGGPASQASFSEPLGLAYGRFGDLFVADQANHRVRKVENFPNYSPTVTPSFTVTPSHSASPTASPSSTASPTFTASPTVSPSSTASPTFTASPSASPSCTISPTFTASPTVSPSATLSPTFTASPTALPTPPPLAIEAALPFPNPDPRQLKLRLRGPCDRLRVAFYSAAGVRVAGAEFPGAPSGWNSLPLEALTRDLGPGVYVSRVDAEREDGSYSHAFFRFLRLPSH